MVYFVGSGSLSTVDAKAMAGGADNYTIVTQHSFVNFVIGIVTGIVTVYPKLSL